MANSVIDKLKQDLPTILKRELPGVALIYLFGSQISEQATERSDIDIAVLCDHKIDPIRRWHVQERVAQIFSCDADLVDLLKASTVMQFQIIANGLCIYQNSAQQTSFEMQVMSMYQHLNQEREQIIKQYINN